jgi:hypothetical protein
MEDWIGKKVKKKTSKKNSDKGKPFKSTLWVNTVNGIVDHPNRPGHKAFTFVEDDSCVDVNAVIEA